MRLEVAVVCGGVQVVMMVMDGGQVEVSVRT